MREIWGGEDETEHAHLVLGLVLGLGLAGGPGWC